MLKKYLLAPGPTPVPPEVVLAMAAPVVLHRTPEFGELLRRVSDASAKLFGLSALEMALRQFGHEVPLGRGPGAAQEVLLEMYRNN